MRNLCVFIAAVGMAVGIRATTLEQLSLNDLILKSTTIVHAKVTGSYGAFRGVDVYTFYKLQVSETLKPVSGQGPVQLEVAVPGGVAQNVRQSVPGAPALTVGGDYVLFLWTGPNTLTQILGLSQGLFRMTQDPAGNPIISRPATTEMMLNKAGVPVSDQLTNLRWSDVRTQIRKTLGGN